MKLGQYAAFFADNAIDGCLLLELSAQDLLELAVDNQFHRRRIVNEINKLKARDNASRRSGPASSANVSNAASAAVAAAAGELVRSAFVGSPTSQASGSGGSNDNFVNATAATAAAGDDGDAADANDSTAASAAAAAAVAAGVAAAAPSSVAKRKPRNAALNAASDADDFRFPIPDDVRVGRYYECFCASAFVFSALYARNAYDQYATLLCTRHSFFSS
jgi:hypothetical protein